MEQKTHSEENDIEKTTTLTQDRQISETDMNNSVTTQNVTILNNSQKICFNYETKDQKCAESNESGHKKSKKKRGEGSDAQKVIKRIKDFDPELSPACIKLNEKFGRGIIHEELKCLAEFICTKLNIELDRDAKRDNRVLHKWFHENWCAIEPEIDRIDLFDKDSNQIK